MSGLIYFACIGRQVSMKAVTTAKSQNLKETSIMCNDV